MVGGPGLHDPPLVPRSEVGTFITHDPVRTNERIHQGDPARCPWQSWHRDLRAAAANALGLHLEVLTASAEGDLEAAFKIMVQQRADALVMIADPFFIAWRKQFVALAARWATPAIYPVRYFADVGGLMSYGADTDELEWQLGIYVGKVLKGAKPADLPIQQSTKVELVINLKIATALGLTIPPSLLARADEVIE
jgi:putative tryptophan/tyrosine transport system substrate-binding protein